MQAADKMCDYYRGVYMRLSLVLVLLVGASVPLLQAQQVAARDAFWSAADLVSVSSNPARTSAKATRASDSGHAGTAVKHATNHLDPTVVASRGYGEAPHMVRVSSEQIGLRYSLLLRNSDKSFAETPVSTVFHSGDHLRLSVMANQPGYLYVIQQGSTGNWSPIFPDAGSAKDINKVEQGQVYQVPNGKDAFSFDQNPGQEKLFIMLSRQPIQDLDSTIKGLKQPTPEQSPAPGNGSSYLEASNNIPDELVQRFASRDLSLVQEQEVDDKTANSGSGEKAVYVVSKGNMKGASQQIVASVTLRHE
jgi:hypothetical protein